jgi:sec-independent protein translocase protein TatA
VLVFGTKKLKNMGGDVGGAVNEFKKAMNDNKAEETEDTPPRTTFGNTVTGEITTKPAAKKTARKVSPKKPAAKKASTK